MAIFRVLRRVDAFVDYAAEVEATDAASAARIASDNEEQFSWEQIDVAQYDARLFVTLDDQGNEIEGTQKGDF